MKIRYGKSEDAIKQPNIYVIDIPKGEEMGKGIEHLVNEILSENFQAIERHTVIQMQEIQRTSNKIVIR